MNNNFMDSPTRDLVKIQHIISYIEENYSRTIAIEELEDIGCYSYRNLHRIFQNIFKETLGAFQKRLKLENAYKKLIFSSETITNIAFDVGFESLQAFTKSFKKQFSIAPSEARNGKISIFNSYINEAKTLDKLAYEIVYLDEKQVYYQSIKTAYNNDEINIFWDKIDALYNEKKGINYYGIIVDEPLITLDENCRYEAAISKKPADKTFLKKTIFGGKYLKYIHQGNYDDIENTYRMIYKNWIFQPTIALDNSPIIEHYLEHNNTTSTMENFITEIFIPLKK